MANEVFKATIVTLAGGIVDLDVIEYQASFWIVLRWRPTPDERGISPVRIIPMAKLQYQDRGSNATGSRFFVNSILPTELGDETIPSHMRIAYGVVENPPIVFRHDAGLN